MDPDAAATSESSSPLPYSTPTTCPPVRALASEVVVSQKRHAGSPFAHVAGEPLDEKRQRMTTSMDDDAAAAAAAAASLWGFALGSEVVVSRKRHAGNPPALVAGQSLDEKWQRMMTSIDDDAAVAAAASASLWGFILPDILGVVLRFLPCLADRAAVRSVCRHWRAAASEHSNVPPPLPLLVLPGFRFFSFSTKGTVVAMRRGWMPEEVATGQVSCVGSSEGWLFVAKPSEDGAGSERFLLNAFSREVIRLPRLLAPYCTTSGEHPWIANDDPKYSRSLEHVVLSAPPGSATKCIVAGFSYRIARSLLGITLWQPGMKTWYVYHSHSIDRFSDLVFHQGKLYMLHRWSWYEFQSSPLLFAFTLGEDEHGVNVSGHECPVNIPPIPRPSPRLWQMRSLVLWRGRLVLIIRYVDTSIWFYHTEKVDVFALDLSIDPCGVTGINSFDGDCVFVDLCRCTSFPAGSYEGVQGDCIYFIDNKYNKSPNDRSYVTTVYNMRDGTVKPFLTADLLSGNPAEDNLADAVWVFPSQ